MKTAEMIALSGAVGAILSQVLNFVINKYKVAKQSETADKKIELDWQIEFNNATAAFRTELYATIKDLKQEILDLRNDVDKLRTEKINLEEEVARLRGKNEVQNEEIVRLTKQNVFLEDERQKLEARVQELENKPEGGK